MSYNNTTPKVFFRVEFIISRYFFNLNTLGRFSDVQHREPSPCVPNTENRPRVFQRTVPVCSFYPFTAPATMPLMIWPLKAKYMITMGAMVISMAAICLG